MLINWHDSYSIHNKKIDEQHKMLFELAKKASLMGNKYTSREEIKEILADFFEYMKVHFADEEAYMESIGYPILDDHKQLHKFIIKELASTIMNIKNVNDMKEKLGVIAQEWLLNHILQQDMLIEKYRLRSIIDAESALREAPKPEKPVEVEEPKEEAVAVAPKKREGYYYGCGCENKIHIIPENVHLNIQNKTSVYKCRYCSQPIVFTGESYFEPKS